MLELLKNYTMIEIITLVVICALSIKGIISFFEWGSLRIKKVAHKMEQPKLVKNSIQENANDIDKICASLKRLQKKVDVLTNSDRDDIKAFITRQHHYFCYVKGWIDDYSLDCIERRYMHYEEEGGNSFITGLMKEIRALPKQEIKELREEEG